MGKHDDEVDALSGAREILRSGGGPFEFETVDLGRLSTFGGNDRAMKRGQMLWENALSTRRNFLDRLSTFDFPDAMTPEHDGMSRADKIEWLNNLPSKEAMAKTIDAIKEEALKTLECDPTEMKRRLMTIIALAKYKFDRRDPDEKGKE